MDLLVLVVLEVLVHIFLNMLQLHYFCIWLLKKLVHFHISILLVLDNHMLLELVHVVVLLLEVEHILSNMHFFDCFYMQLLNWLVHFHKC